MALSRLDVVLEDHVWSALHRYCERNAITPDQLVADHLQALVDQSAAAGDGEPDTADR